ncbi:MAG: FAD-dependent oxidoreductase [Candidatus Nitrospinota bacterium M3_3B_026]
MSHVFPVWENKTAPCGGTRGCPAFTNISASLHALSLNDPNTAWRIMMETHPLRAVLGRVCYAFCEQPCNRGYFDKPISIQALEAVIGDHGFDPAWRPPMAPRNGEKVLIIGAGPAGLAAGWFLNIHGFDVTIREAAAAPGGVLRYGIPSYRLPKDVLDREIKLIADSGVRIITESPVTTDEIEKLLDGGEFGAAIVCSGAGKSRKAGMPGEEKAASGIEFLRRINSGQAAPDELEGKRVVVVGGGNVAMDAARSAVRLGAESVTVAYRRDEEAMPAHEKEVREAREEGVVFRFLLAPEEYDGGTLTARKMKLGAEDASGRREPVPTDETVDLPADVLLISIGQEPEVFNIERENVFLAGDAAPDARGTVIHAIASGKRAADSVSELVTGKKIFPPLREEVTWAKMNVSRYFEPKARLRLFTERPGKRRLSFEPVEKIPGLDEGVMEAGRCFRCGTCLGGLDSDCDWCFRASGDKGCVDKFMEPWNPEGPLFTALEGCDACGRCWEDCPRYVVTPVKVREER